MPINHKQQSACGLASGQMRLGMPGAGPAQPFGQACGCGGGMAMPESSMMIGRPLMIAPFPSTTTALPPPPPNVMVLALLFDMTVHVGHPIAHPQ
jgi:hypothetical protein